MRINLENEQNVNLSLTSEGMDSDWHVALFVDGKKITVHVDELYSAIVAFKALLGRRNNRSKYE